MNRVLFGFMLAVSTPFAACMAQSQNVAPDVFLSPATCPTCYFFDEPPVVERDPITQRFNVSIRLSRPPVNGSSAAVFVVPQVGDANCPLGVVSIRFVNPPPQGSGDVVALHTTQPGRPRFASFGGVKVFNAGPSTNNQLDPDETRLDVQVDVRSLDVNGAIGIIGASQALSSPALFSNVKTMVDIIGSVAPV